MGKLVVGKNDLESSYNSALKEWDYERNGDLKPSMVSIGSKKKVWWKCQDCGYEWIAAVYNRTKANPSGCPQCSGRVGKKLSSTLISEWHPSRNGDLSPYNVKAGSSLKVWWKCQRGHEWQMTVITRSKGSGCPFCQGKMLTSYCELINEWHPVKNGAVLPHEIKSNSKRKVWWLGKCGHEWQASVSDRTAKGAGCPFCSGNRVLVGFNDLETTNPSLAKEWHPTKNNRKKACDFTQSSTYEAWWLGKCGHEWKAVISSRNAGAGCPICAKRQRTSFPEQVLYYYLSKLFPDAQNGYTEIFSNKMELDLYFPSLKVGIEYDGIAWHNTALSEAREQTKYRICKECGITLMRIKEADERYNSIACDRVFTVSKAPSFSELDKLVHTIAAFLGCNSIPFQVNTAVDSATIKEQYLAVIKAKSLASIHPELVLEWHPTKNGQLSPEMFYPYSQDSVWWLGKCGHEWQATISGRSSGMNCPYCSGKRVLAGFNDLETTNPSLAKEWHPTKNGSMTPREVTGGSGKKVWWLGKCGHEWEARISDRQIKGSECPFCQGKKLLSGYNDLATVNPMLASEWHYVKNEGLSPSDITANSKKQVWWLGKCGHEWQAAISARNRGNGCPFCSGHRVLSGFNDLESQNPEILLDWDYSKNKDLLPSSVTVRSGRKVYWKCSTCGNESLASPHDKKPCANCRRMLMTDHRK